LFKTMGLEYDMQLIMSGVLNCVQLVGVSSSLWTMDRIGRRPLLLWGSAVMFISHLIISVLVGKFSHDWPSYRPEGWASVAMLLVFMLAFGASWVSLHRISSYQRLLIHVNRVLSHGQCHPKSSPPASVPRVSRKSLEHSLLFRPFTDRQFADFPHLVTGSSTSSSASSPLP
jgi:hypothetical protein